MADDSFDLKDTKKVILSADEEQSATVKSPADTGMLSKDKLLGTIIAEKYRIDKVLGAGGLGIVYKGQHLLLNRAVAIKIMLPTRQLDDKAILRFQREAQAAIDLKHSNIAGIHDFGLHQDLPFIVMEFVDGIPLGFIIDQQGAIEPQRALRLLKQLCDGLGTAHKNHVVHRDIKPDNLMIRTLADGEEELKIIDFGIAKIVEGDTRNLTQTGEVFGTPTYMSPEQCLGRKTDQRSDVYAVGCVAYEMFTGNPPFLAESPLEVIMKHINDDPPTLNYFKDICPGIQSVVARALTKNPSYRYASAEEMAEDIELILAGQRPKDRGLIIDRKFISRAILIGGSLVLLGGSAGFFLLKPPPPPPKKDTVEYWTVQINKDPKNAKAYIERGRLNLKSDEFPEALADFNKALELDPKGEQGYQAYRLRSQMSFVQERYVNALSDANKAVNLRPDDHRAYLERAAAASELQKYKEAIADCEKSLSLNPKNEHGNKYWAYYNEAAIYNTMGRHSDGKAAAEKAIRLNDSLPQAYAARADANIGLKNYKEALSDTNEVLTQIAPKHVESLLNRAFAYFYLNQLDKAKADIDKVLELDRRYKAYVLRGRILSAQKRYDEAIQDFAQAHEIDQKGDFTLFYEHAKALMGAGQYQEALAELSTALKLEPSNSEALLLEKTLQSKAK